MEPHYSGGMAINHSDPSTLYVSRPIKGVFEIEKWSTPDKGQTWRSRLITLDSKQNNVRPVVPRGYDGKRDYVLWMSGAYEHYTNYRTGIRLLYGGDALGSGIPTPTGAASVERPSSTSPK